MKKGMLFGVIFGLVISIFLVGIVSAVPACGDANDDDLIMRLFQQNNSHGATYDFTGGYNEEICYDEFFGGTGGGVHTCAEADTIIWLSDTYNSHASTTKIIGSYETQVCYDGVERHVETISGPGSCVDGVTLLSLYQNNNSHISAGNDPNYPVKICCSGAQLTSSFWQKMNGVPISLADLNDWVQLNASGIGLTGRNITYEIIKVDGGFLWFDKKVATISSAVITTWKANESGDFYFEAALEGDDVNETSNILTVSDTEHNSYPVAVITGPEDRQMYFKGTDLDFTQASYDEDDVFDYTWDLGDETTFSGNSANKNNWEFTYAYSTAGQKDVVLSVDDGRGGVGRDMISILILDDASVDAQTLAYIASPDWGEGYGRTIDFDGDGSYVAEYDSVNVDVNCLAGPCPLTTKNSPGGGAGLDVEGGLLDYSNINFTWLFTNGLTGATATENAQDNPMIRRSFDTPSVPGFPHKATLTVDYI